MPKYLNLQNGETIDYTGPENDVATGVNIPMSKTFKKDGKDVQKYRKVVTVVKDGVEKDITDDILDAAVAKGYSIKELSDAKGKGYDKAQVAKYGEVGVNEAILRKTNPLSDEIGGAIESPIGALKAVANYVLPESIEFSESDKDVKKYRDKTELERAREDRGEETFPLETGLTSLSSAIQTPGIGAASKVGKIAAGAAEGLGYAVAEDEDKSVYNAENLGGAAIGAALPAVGAALETGGNIIRNRLAQKGNGAGTKYLDNPELLKENLGARDRAEDIQKGVKVRNQEIDENIIPIEKKIDEVSARSDVEMANRDKLIGKMDQDIEKSIEESAFAKGNIKTALEEFKTIKTDASRQKLNAMLKSYEESLSDLGTKRDARFEELEAFPATEEAKTAYRNLRANLQTDIGEMEEEAAIKALRELEKFMPEKGLDTVSQGQLLKKMKRVSSKLYKKVKTGPGYGTDNFNRSEIASKVNDAFKNAGDKQLKDLTEAMAEPINHRQFVRAAATKKVPEIVNGRNTKVYSPDPMKVENASPETVKSMEAIGYKPTLTKELAAEQKRLDKEIEKLEFRTKILKSGRDSLKKEPTALSGELMALKNQKQELQSRAKELNVQDNRSFLNEVEKAREIDALYGRQTGPEAAAGAALDVTSMVLPAGVERVGRKGLGAVTDPVRQIETYNKVREVFNKPALTAAVKAMTIGGRTLSRQAIMGLAEQHQVDPNELESSIREGGN